ncbi:MAG: glutamine--fructose-6-phosphate transaminase (isomerizing), partial [Proteobacteria bacterium]|nr:glutamine--fructose-6-phosphate transaminase (isomerizing) [Pseudomonadota bacterium]
MCGIVGAIAERDVVPILMEGLRRLEYRGYDSAGIAVVDENRKMHRLRRVGKVQALQNGLDENPMRGTIGISHTRWATHGEPNEVNAHPQSSGDYLSIVHNGIIENYLSLKQELLDAGYEFESETDTEVVAHRIDFHLQKNNDLLSAVRATVAELVGAYALVIVSSKFPDRLIAARCGTPVVIGLGTDENYVASDVTALLPVTRRFIFLEDGDVAEITGESVKVLDSDGKEPDRPVRESQLSADAMDKGQYRHFMLKEIYEQPEAVANTLAERVAGGHLLEQAFGLKAHEVFSKTRAVHIIACGTSYHAGLVARYQIEQICRLPCSVDIASEYRYRDAVVSDNTLFVTISQSGETLDTLEALRAAKKKGYLAHLAICNVAESSLIRESSLVLMTRAGPEIGVASTKAFTTQLTALALLAIALGRGGALDADAEQNLIGQLSAIRSSA